MLRIAWNGEKIDQKIVQQILPSPSQKHALKNFKFMVGSVIESKIKFGFWHITFYYYDYIRKWGIISLFMMFLILLCGCNSAVPQNRLEPITLHDSRLKVLLTFFTPSILWIFLTIYGILDFFLHNSTSIIPEGWSRLM